jgi:hypothetical protein
VDNSSGPPKFKGLQIYTKSYLTIAININRKEIKCDVYPNNPAIASLLIEKVHITSLNFCKSPIFLPKL